MAMDLERDIADRAAGSYIVMYESLAEEQQVAELSGDKRKADKAGFYAPIARAAVDAEIHDPDPKDVPYMHCIECLFYVRRARR